MNIKSNLVSELDLLLYILAIERRYYELLELYGMFYENSKCKHCGHDNQIQFKMISEVISNFGENGFIRIPKNKELKQISRDITIWRGLTRCEETSLSLRVEEYSKRYKMSQDNVYKIRHRVQAMANKFLTMKRVFKKRVKRADSK